jgi:hypothetical protein
MKKLLFGLAVLPFLAGVSLAGQPLPLTDQQMDKVTAGFDFSEIDHANLGTVAVAINLPAANPCNSGCFLAITGTTFPAGTQSFQLFAAFGPRF